MSNLYPPAVRGGYEVECQDVVEHLRERHEVTVLTSVQGRGEVAGEAGVLRTLPWVRHAKADSLQAPRHALLGVRAARAALAAARPELVYVWNGAQIPQAALQVLTTEGPPVAFRICEHWFRSLYTGDVFLRHLTPGERGLRGAWARAMRLANRHPELRIDLDRPVRAAVSWNSQALRTAAPAPPPVRTVHEAVTHPSSARVEVFAGVERRPAPAEAPRILFAGRLDRHKGPDVAVRAFAALRARHPGATLLLAGEGPERDALAALAGELGVGDAVELPGALRGDALLAEVARASAWVVPSVWEEPAGLVCTEAALARVPAVLSRVGGIPEMLREEEHALFFAKGDHAGCAEALHRALSDPGTPERVARAFARGQELRHAPYLRAMDAFLADGLAALGRPAA